MVVRRVAHWAGNWDCVMGAVMAVMWADESVVRRVGRRVSLTVATMVDLTVDRMVDWTDPMKVVMKEGMLAVV